MMNGNVNYRRKIKIGFFCGLKEAGVYPEEVRGWFFDIYIQGSKYNF
jgi:hypothetical protein